MIAAGLPAGLKAALTGPAGQFADISNAFSGLDTTLLLVTAAVVAFILILTYRSPGLWLVPLVSVGRQRCGVPAGQARRSDR